MTIKVIQFIGGLSDGGAETVVKDYVCFYKQNNIGDITVEPIVVTLMNEKTTANYRRVKDAGVRVITIYQKYNIVSKIHREFFGFFYVPYKLKKIIEEEKPNVIHIHLGLLHYFLPIAKYMKNIKLIYTCHSVPNRYIGKDRPDENAAVKFLLKHNGLQIIALQSEMKKEIDDMFGTNNTKVLYNGIDVEKFSKVHVDKYEERKKMLIPVDAFVIGHVGRFSKEKNHSFLLDVFSKYQQTNDKAFLLLVGWGNLEEQIKEKIKILHIEKCCMILSHRTDIPQLLSVMDIFLFPSLLEGLGNAFIEAQLMGLKCIKSNNVPEDVIISNNTASLSLEDSMDDWCKAIDFKGFNNHVFNTIDDFRLKTIMSKLTQIYLE